MLGGFKDEDDVDYDDSMFFFQKRYDEYVYPSQYHFLFLHK